MATVDTKKRRVIDWEAIENDFRAGILSLREMGAAHNVSHVMIAKRAKAEGWTRDLNARIQAKADALVNKALVNDSVNSDRIVNEREIIEANAARIAQVRGDHRSDITRTRKLALDMLSELEHETGNVDLYEELGEMLRKEDDRGNDKRNDIYHKVISSAGRIDSLKKLAETLKTLIGLEREAYGIGPEVIKTEVEHTGTISHERPKLTREEWLKVNGLA